MKKIKRSIFFITLFTTLFFYGCSKEQNQIKKVKLQDGSIEYHHNPTNEIVPRIPNVEYVEYILSDPSIADHRKTSIILARDHTLAGLTVNGKKLSECEQHEIITVHNPGFIVYCDYFHCNHSSSKYKINCVQYNKSNHALIVDADYEAPEDGIVLWAFRYHSDNIYIDLNQITGMDIGVGMERHH